MLVWESEGFSLRTGEGTRRKTGPLRDSVAAIVERFVPAQQVPEDLWVGGLDWARPPVRNLEGPRDT